MMDAHPSQDPANDPERNERSRTLWNDISAAARSDAADGTGPVPEDEEATLKAVHQALLNMDEDGEGITDARLGNMRRAVLSELESSQKARDHVIRPLPRDPKPDPAAPRRPWLPLLAIAASLLIGVFLGARLVRSQTDPFWWYQPVGAHAESAEPEFQDAVPVLSQVVASRNPDLESLPYTYGNISVEPTKDGRVAVSFDVAAHVSLVRTKDDPLVKDMLVRSLMSPESIHSSLQAIGMTDSVMDPEIKRALIRAMESDSELAVRMKAMSKLAQATGDSEVRQALLRVLKEDPSVTMRIDALDCLMGDAPNDNLLREIEAELRERGDTPLLMRVNEWERH
ncbi:hypothetical protein SCOR_34260 [Sulfidibacter corallicola]|uniref:HEAT repeat domain-containing protein n=1 Tax=Sulfidibacter corallicola TaxID=2818388 RepID=A0A8A4TIM3_SULCO|nr:hypothetical protein [Sulfidibacter corallicola]QTD49400.1 hypothetical protein J3U87_27765 [Sulfidibacter corallicola]